MKSRWMLNEPLVEIVNAAREKDERLTRPSDVRIARFLGRRFEEGAPIVFTAEGFRRFVPEKGTWAKLADEQVARAIQALDGINTQPHPGKDKGEGDEKEEKYKPLSITDKLARGTLNQLKIQYRRDEFFNGARPGAHFKNVYVGLADDGTFDTRDTPAPDDRVLEEHTMQFDFPLTTTVATPVFDPLPARPVGSRERL